MHSSQQELLIKTLLMKELTFTLKELITHLKKILVKNEHSGIDDPIVTKYFYLYFLLVTDWQRNCLNETIAKIIKVYRRRNVIVSPYSCRLLVTVNYLINL